MKKPEQLVNSSDIHDLFHKYHHKLDLNDAIEQMPEENNGSQSQVEEHNNTDSQIDNYDSIQSTNQGDDNIQSANVDDEKNQADIPITSNDASTESKSESVDQNDKESGISNEEINVFQTVTNVKFQAPPTKIEPNIEGNSEKENAE